MQRPMHDLLFPQYEGKFRSVRIEKAAREYREAFPERSELLHSHDCAQSIIERANREVGAQCSFGGYMETRIVLTNHTHHGKEDLRLHLGTDYNVPKGTPICAPANLNILYVEKNPDTSVGLGTAIFAQVEDTDIVLLFTADIDISKVNAGDKIKKGKRFSQVTLTQYGNWPHLHLQVMSSKEYRRQEAQKFQAIDVYGKKSRVKSLMRRFPYSENINLPSTTLGRPQILQTQIHHAHRRAEHP